MFDSIKTKLTLLLVFVGFLSMSAVIALSLFLNERALSNDIQSEADKAAHVAKEAAAAVLVRLNGYAGAIARDQALAHQIAEGQSEALETHVVAYFNHLFEQDKTVKTVELTDAKGIVVMRGHNPGKKGDNKATHPMIKAALESQSTAGLTVSPATGEMAQDAVYPIRLGDKVVGTIKVGSYLREDTAAYLKVLTGAEVVFVVNGKVNASTIKEMKVEALAGVLAKNEGQRIVATGAENFNAATVILSDRDGKQGATIVVLSSRARIADGRNRFMAWIGGVSLALLALLALTAMVISARVSLPVVRVAEALNRISQGQGDLTARMEVRGKDEIAAIAHAFNAMMAGLQSMVSATASSAQQVREAASHLVSAMSQVRNSIDAQSESASSMAASVEELTVSITHAAGMASDSEVVVMAAANLGQEGAGLASISLEKMKNLVDTGSEATELTRRLTEESRRIGSIVDVIKDIADQTNLLALNAAIEAARAGEQGRGFAVVADEVRKLAERTGKEVSTINDIVSNMDIVVTNIGEVISHSADEERHESEMALRVRNLFDDVSRRATDAATRMKDIAYATQEQSTAAAGIARHVETVAHAAEENSLAVTEVNESTVRLQNLATDLQKRMAGFRY